MNDILKRMWSYNVAISGDEGWFVATELNMLFKIDLQTGKCQYVLEFPDSEVRRYGMNQVQLKEGRYLLCLPDKGQKMWIFDIISEELKEIGILNPDNLRVGVSDAFVINNTLFAVASDRKQIIEIKWDGKIGLKYYDVFDHIEKGDLGYESILVEQKIYIVCNLSNQICEFDIRTKKIVYYSVQNVTGGLTTICYDGNYFWLSGFSRQLYIWDKKKGQTRVLVDFPLEFGSYEVDDAGVLTVNNERKISKTSLFTKSLNGKEDIWFIPLQTNYIIYVNKNDFEFQIFDITNEFENVDSWHRGMKQKYIVEYIRENCIIGLYSLKNDIIVEVNIDKKESSQIPLIIDKKDRSKIWNNVFRNDFLFMENSDEDFYYFLNKCNVLNPKNFLSKSIGNKIYEG